MHSSGSERNKIKLMVKKILISSPKLALRMYLNHCTDNWGVNPTRCTCSISHNIDAHSYHKALFDDVTSNACLHFTSIFESCTRLYFWYILLDRPKIFRQKTNRQKPKKTRKAAVFLEFCKTAYQYKQDYNKMGLFLSCSNQSSFLRRRARLVVSLVRPRA